MSTSGSFSGDSVFKSRCRLVIRTEVLHDFPHFLKAKAEVLTLPKPSAPTAQQPLLGQGFLIIEASRSLTDTPHPVGVLWTSDQAVAGTSTCQHTTLTRGRYACSRRDSKQQS